VTLNDVHMTTASDGWAVGSNSEILHYDGGSWSRSNTGTDPNLYFSGVDATDANNAWAVGNAPGGAQGSASVGGGQVTTIAVTNPGSGYYTPPTVTLSSQTGSGATATAVISGGAVTAINVGAPGSGYATPPTVSLSAGTGCIFRTVDGGTNWTEANPAPSVPSWINAIDMVNANTGYAVGSGGAIFKTTNGGTSWSAQSSGTSKILAGVSFVDANNGRAVGGDVVGGRIISTRNGGQTWVIEDSGTTVDLRSVSVHNTGSEFISYATGANSAILRAETNMIRSYYFTWYDNVGGSNWVLMANPVSGSGSLMFDLYIGGAQRSLAGYNNGQVAPGSSITPIYGGVIGGPVRVDSLNGKKAIVSQRILWPKGGSSIEEVLGTDAARLSNHYYWTWYDGTSGFKNWILVANPNGFPVYYRIKIAGTSIWSGSIPAGQNVTPIFPGRIGGPVEVEAWKDSGRSTPADVFASQRVLSNGDTAFNEQVGTPADELSNHYLWTWYDDVGGSNWMLLANPGASPMYYKITVAGQVVAHDNGAPIAPGQKITPRFGITGGPVEVTTWKDAGHSVPMDSIASQRVIWGPSFAETPGYPHSALSSSYHWTWYDNVEPGMTNWVLVANPNATAVTYTIKVAGVARASGTLAPGQRVTPTFPGLRGGPVEVVSTGGPVMASQRVLFNNYFNEVLGTVLD
jgi:photosystem II stability/assembly factor-like uncharacterized protein